MKRFSICISVGLAATCALVGTRVRGGDGNPSDSGAAAEPVSEYRYVGTRKCRSCHGVWYASWQKNAKGSSWNALKPEVNTDLKVLVGLNPKTDYRTDSACLACHSVGFGHSSGYAVPDSDTGKAARRAAQREGASCESCHGPGSGFVQVMSDVMNRERPYRQEELHAAGLRRITRETCRTCHTMAAPCIIPNGDGGTHPPGAIDVKRSDRHGFHERIHLKYRIKSGATDDGVAPARRDDNN